MIQPELWMLTPFVLFLYLRIPLINAEGDKAGRKLNDQNENYIITHYGVEYYTPVTDVESPAHNSGYYTAEVIPVDVNTGEELKTVKNLFVPMHTGYSIGVENPHSGSSEFGKKNDINGKTTATWTAAGPETRDDSKSKIPKKFKNKYSTKRTSPSNNEVSSTRNPEVVTEIQNDNKRNRKRNIENSSDEFLTLFYENLRSLIQRHYLK